MSFSILEDVRATHQELDRLTNQLTHLLLPGPPNSHRDRLIQSHRANYLAELISLRAGQLLESYADLDGERAIEIEKLSSTTSSSAIDRNNAIGNGKTNTNGTGNGSVDMTEFYSRLSKMNDFHRKYPNQALALDSSLSQHFDWTGLEGEIIDGRDFLDRMFTGEEMLGRYLDLHLAHDTFNNLTYPSSSAVKRLPYISFIDSFDQFESIPRTKKSRPEYHKYLQELRDYLQSFHRRTQPLYDLSADLSTLATSFDSDWSQGLLPGWAPIDQSEPNGKPSVTRDNGGIWCEACTKLYAKQTVYDAHLKSKRHMKALERLRHDRPLSGTDEGPKTENDPITLQKLRRAQDKPVALLEQEIRLLGKLLETIRVDTKANVERRAALTDKERQQEIEEFEAREAKERIEAERLAELNINGVSPEKTAGAGEDDDDDEARIYNPLKLPLGWDGKPIPYWLYKLHGLGVEYKCEICSDFIYMGRKNFERHFQESRHAFGMRALGLPNTKHFHEITRIEDAFALAEKLKSEGRAEIFRDETMEELEDEEGNVYNRKTYEDLKRQGLL